MLTLFRNKDELSALHSARLVYMAGAAEHRKDALEFLLHDLKHMEHFVDPVTHREQVGFCRAMLSLGDGWKVEVDRDEEKSLLLPLHRSAEDRDHERGQGLRGVGEAEEEEQCPIQRDRDDPPVSSPSSSSYCNLTAYFLQGCGFDRRLWEELEYVISDM